MEVDDEFSFEIIKLRAVINCVGVIENSPRFSTDFRQIFDRFLTDSRQILDRFASWCWDLKTEVLEAN